MGTHSKTGVDGLTEHYKARLIAQGFSQKYGDDYDEIFVQLPDWNHFVVYSIESSVLA